MNKKFVMPAGIYGITAEEYSLGRSNVEVVKSMIKAGVKILQYREKENKTMKNKLLECRQIREITRGNGQVLKEREEVPRGNGQG